MPTTPNHAWTPRWTPLRAHAEQLRLWADPSRFEVVPAARRSGKTELAKRKWWQDLRDLLRPEWKAVVGRSVPADAAAYSLVQSPPEVPAPYGSPSDIGGRGTEVEHVEEAGKRRRSTPVKCRSSKYELPRKCRSPYDRSAPPLHSSPSARVQGSPWVI